jgi:hypothetical protein
MLAWLIEKKEMVPHVPAWDKIAKDNTISGREIERDEHTNEYRCPAGHALRSDRRKFNKCIRNFTAIFAAHRHTLPTLNGQMLSQEIALTKALGGGYRADPPVEPKPR